MTQLLQNGAAMGCMHLKSYNIKRHV